LLLPEDTRGWRAAAGLALVALEQLECVPVPLDSPSVRLDSGEWPGRFQVLRREPPLVLDVAHNPPALQWLSQELAVRWPHRRFQIVVAGMEDKALDDNLRALKPVAEALWVFLPAGHRRAAGREAWEAAARRAGVAIAGWLDEGSLHALRGDVETGRSEAAWLVTGSFLSVAAWLGAEQLPPGL
jgi:dihydrofolate synthase/folylpolyglutamate synthase